MKNNTIKPLGKGEKTIFALTDFYGGGGQALIGVVYFFFLTTVIKLSPALAGVVTLISEIWDAVSDQLMGIISDNTRTKFGRRRPYLFIGGCLLAVAFALIFLPIEKMEETWKFIYCAATYLFYNTVSTIILVSYNGLSAEISEKRSERDSANVLRLVISTASAAVCTLLPSIVLDAYRAGSIDTITLYLVIGVGFGILFALPVVLCAVFARERGEIFEEKQRFSVLDMVRPLKNRPFRQLVGMYLGQALCMDVFSTGVALFATYVTNPKGSVTLFLGIFIAVQLIAFIFINRLVKCIDINKIYRFGLPLSVLALIVFGVFGSNLYVAYVSVFFIALGFAGAQLTSWIMFPHTVDAGELVTGKRQSGSYSAIMTFARKSSSALVIFLFSLVLEFTGYDADLEIQPPSAQNGIKYVMAFTCIAFMVFGFFMAKKYILTKDKNEKIEKYLPFVRNGETNKLTESEREELSELKKSIL